jgi:hypothetical protein
VSRARYIAQAGVIAAVYGALTLLVVQFPWGYGPVQFRWSEAFTVVACLTPAGVPGLWLGCVAANAFGALGPLDIIFGSVATLLGAAWTWRNRERTLVALAGPVVSNALIVPAYLPILLGGSGYYTVPLFGIDVDGSWLGMYLFGVVAVGLGQALAVYGLGLPLLAALKGLGLDRLWDPHGRKGRA